MFDFLEEGERVCGEWMGMAVGTLYELPHDPFVAFDIMRNGYERATHDEFVERVGDILVMPQLLSKGPPLSVEEALKRLDPEAHGAREEIEGAVWKVERDGKFDFIAKYVRHDKVDGKWFPDISGMSTFYHWHPKGYKGPFRVERSNDD
jgi:hypothetical protein